MSIMNCEKCSCYVDTDFEEIYEVCDKFHCENCIFDRCNDPEDTIYQCERCSYFFDWKETPCSKIDGIWCDECLAEYSDEIRDYVQMEALND